MKVAKYLKESQPIVFQTFYNALSSSHLSHAYLLVGEQGTPLLESALYLAKSIVCDNPNPLACEECLTCLRIDEGNYADIIVIDGMKSSIKKDDIKLIESQFKTSSIEKKGKMIYIINHIENMMVEAINSLLKFLEEPHENIIAFLTCENENRVLPTIVSRTQVLHFKSINKAKIKQSALELNIEPIDVELLCNFFNNAELIKQKVDDKDYQNAKSAILTTIDAINNEPVSLAKIHTSVFPNVKTKESARYYLDMLSIIFKDLLSLTNNGEININSLESELKNLTKHLTHIEQSLLLILTSRGQIEMNINISLLLDHVLNYILEGDE